MPGDMRFDESLVADYLTNHLGPLTKADPVILAEYVVALLRNDKPKKELQKLCADSLVEFLGPSTNSFITKLFQALEDGSITRSGERVDSMKKSEPSRSPGRVDNLQVKHSSQGEQNTSSSESASDPDDIEVTDDDDDDDRNHKHRRREARPNSLDNDAGELSLRRPNRMCHKPNENGRLFAETDPHSSSIQKGRNPSLDRDFSSKFDNQNSGLMPPMRASFDSGSRSRLSHRPDLSRFDLSASAGRPPNIRGRGRSAVPWNQHDSRFNPLETLDFASKMASHGHTHPHIFMGTGLASAASGQSPSWSSFGMIPGMSTGILDPLHPLSLQGSLQPPITPPLNLGMARQRCRDFEERGFCLRGDMCPMEHGVNRIVVEDVQSLSQFNLPVSIPSAHALGLQSGKGSLPTVNASSSLLVNNKALPGKSNKSGVGDDVLHINGVPSAPSGAEADVYDPDQPLWNNDRPGSSSALLGFTSPNIEDGAFLDCDTSNQQNQKFIDNNEGGCPVKNLSGDVGSRGTSIWGRIGSGTKSETGNKMDDSGSATGYPGKEMGTLHEKAKSSTPAPSGGKDAATEGTVIKETAAQFVPRPSKDFGRNHPKAAQRASRTLYVNGIPLKNNRRDALLSHFQKFGMVVDIYIPLNSEKAFVQFSKREEAEAALKAPDAVMGNRFIKLWWANRDSIPDEVQTNATNKAQQLHDVLVPSVSSQPATSVPAAQKGSTASASEMLMPVAGPQKNVHTNYSKAAPPVQKKLETLEHLKEEIRKKQELLAQKRNDFWRQLNKLEKQAVSVNKVEVSPEQAGKRQKVDKNVDATKTVPSNITNLSTLPSQDGNARQMDCASAGLSKISKLDTHRTSFVILTPLPPGLANVDALKEHFSSFSDLSSVVIEEPEGNTPDAGLEMPLNCSARITFSTCKSAEEAFLVANHWQGHNLQVKWLEENHHSSDEFNKAPESVPHSTAEGGSNISIRVESMTSRPLSPSIENQASNDSGEAAAAAIRTEESSMDVDHTNHLPETLLEGPLTTTESGPATLSPEKRPSETHVSMA
ncbi:zinc finger CCCH domain-containing protein 27 isoform X2 [Dioscorea cayenensis subsp. rotundata]|uniref:Zinc finger CCCH domain-containing protein 27 isoform X2 n=1 Tax=Dioscorea cayennensis subsp. rotundata TaxID=55577 RepID=A0AB40CUE1_DIOCR|nr:zinc finger CCCH domain-containing protein 27 isoform X2 [Dioscorea cayenensis subsp. rotundata]